MLEKELVSFSRLSCPVRPGHGTDLRQRAGAHPQLRQRLPPGHQKGREDRRTGCDRTGPQPLLYDANSNRLSHSDALATSSLSSFGLMRSNFKGNMWEDISDSVRTWITTDHAKRHYIAWEDIALATSMRKWIEKYS